MENEYTKKFYKIGEVAKMLEVPTSTIRYWEKEFKQIKPIKNRKGDRLFTQEVIEKLKEVKHLVHDRGIKISRAGKKLNENTSLTGNKNKDVIKRLLELKETLLKIKANL